jgi:hypothetical protein
VGSPAVQLTILVLKVRAAVQIERFRERGSDQNQTWLRGRRSKVKNIEDNFNLLHCIQHAPNNNQAEMEAASGYVLARLISGA